MSYQVTPADRQRLRDAVNADIHDDGVRILLHRAINGLMHVGMGDEAASPDARDLTAPIWRIVETDNFGGDYPDERFVNVPPMAFQLARQIADVLNAADDPHSPRCWKVEHQTYRLVPGFEP